MPANLIEVNGCFRWYIGDSKMNVLLEILDAIGERQSDIEDQEEAILERVRCEVMGRGKHHS